MFKRLVATVIVSLMTSAHAQDMSRTERYEDAYRTRSDGSSEYIGSCVTHEDYEGKNFKQSSIILGTLIPGDFSQEELKRKLMIVDSSLLVQIAKSLDFELSDFRDFVDDITIDRIQMSKYITTNFVRANVGVGGGNGSFLVFSQVGKTYTLMSKTFDKDVEFCDLKVWMKRK